jgi:hypothetical protein
MMWNFEHLLDRIGGKYAELETPRKRRRKITSHNFRRFVFSTISDLGYTQYADEFIGHSSNVSTYYHRTEKQKIEVFRKVEPYLTYPDQGELESRHADVISRLEIVEHEKVKLKQEVSKYDELQRQIQELTKRIGG